MRDQHDKDLLSRAARGEFEKPMTNGFENHDDGSWPAISSARDNGALEKLAVILLIVALVLVVLATVRW